MRIHALAAAVVFFAVPAIATPVLPGCVGPVEIDNALMLRVERNGVVALTDGRAVVLEGIRLPSGTADHGPQSFMNQALAALTLLTQRAPLTLTSTPPKEDRYDRVRGQLINGDNAWIQPELLKRGLARVMIAPDRTECASELFAAEAAARTAKAGIWSQAAYAIRTPDKVANDGGTFQIVEGKVLDTLMKNGRAYLNFGTDWKRDFTVVIEHDDLENFRRTGVDPLSYKGQTIRVRGIVQWLNGPEIEVANPQSIEVVR
ncbi:MAG: thermonuclease family protein [Alphaproteobacteria bacterium]|nr:thermonuclease family protein [Alphaproteobacteria bacterium]